ncbi:MAG: NADP-dependent oxidoreductase [Burkholderiales bacterium]
MNRQVLLASRPQGAPTEENFRIVETPPPSPGAGEVLVRNQWLSLDPYMRGRMSDAKSYVPPAKLGEVMVGQTVGVVEQSNDARFAAGDTVLTSLGWQSHGVARAGDLERVDASIAPASYYLGVLGMPGLTAWFGLFEVGMPKPGETVVVSTASGAVGSIVGQLARLHGCRAVGIAGGPAKCDHVVRDLGFDACVDYKAGRLVEDLRAACPGGVDVDFENVGGGILEAMLKQMNRYSRIVVCGLIAEYSRTEAYGYQGLRAILVNRIRVQGMLVFDWKERYPEARRALAALVGAGKLRYRESVANGLDAAPRAFIGLLKGENTGKQLVKLDA